MGTRRFWGVRETYPCVVSGGRHPNKGTTWRMKPARPPFEVEESKTHPGFPGNVVTMSGDSLKRSALQFLYPRMGPKSSWSRGAIEEVTEEKALRGQGWSLPPPDSAQCMVGFQSAKDTGQMKLGSFSPVLQ